MHNSKQLDCKRTGGKTPTHKVIGSKTVGVQVEGDWVRQHGEGEEVERDRTMQHGEGEEVKGIRPGSMVKKKRWKG